MSAIEEWNYWRIGKQKSCGVEGIGEANNRASHKTVGWNGSHRVEKDGATSVKANKGEASRENRRPIHHQTQYGRFCVGRHGDSHGRQCFPRTVPYGRRIFFSNDSESLVFDDKELLLVESSTNRTVATDHPHLQQTNPLRSQFLDRLYDYNLRYGSVCEMQRYEKVFQICYWWFQDWTPSRWDVVKHVILHIHAWSYRFA